MAERKEPDDVLIAPMATTPSIRVSAASPPNTQRQEEHKTGEDLGMVEMNVPTAQCKLHVVENEIANAEVKIKEPKKKLATKRKKDAFGISKEECHVLEDQLARKNILFEADSKIIPCGLVCGPEVTILVVVLEFTALVMGTIMC